MKTKSKIIMVLSISTAALAAGLALSLAHPRIVTRDIQRPATNYVVSNVTRTRLVAVPYPVGSDGAVDDDALAQIYADYSNYVALPISLTRSNDYIVARHYEAEGRFYDPPIERSTADIKNEIAVYYTLRRTVAVTYGRELFRVRGVALGVGVLASYDTVSNRMDAGAGVTVRW